MVFCEKIKIYVIFKLLSLRIGGIEVRSYEVCDMCCENDCS